MKNKTIPKKWFLSSSVRDETTSINELYEVKKVVGLTYEQQILYLDVLK